MLRLAPRRVAPPDALPVSLAEAKAHLRVEHSEDDTLISAMVAAAVGRIDATGRLGRCLMPQDWAASFIGWNGGRLDLPFPDATDVVVTYLDTDDVEQTLDTATFEVIETVSTSVVLRKPSATWPSLAYRPAPITVTATYGFADAAAVPAEIKHAILLMVADMYKFRETAVVGAVSAEIKMSPTVENLLAGHIRGYVA